VEGVCTGATKIQPYKKKSRCPAIEFDFMEIDKILEKNVGDTVGNYIDTRKFGTWQCILC
jgi:hypothetical protein